MKKVILDTNALMAISEFKLKLFDELEKVCDFNYDIYVLTGTIKELNKIQEEQRMKYKRAAKLALGIIKVLKIKQLPSEGHVDDSLVEQSKNGDLVLTQDLGLKRRLTRPYLTIRQKKKIFLVD
jgi:rRNA-processing protein FCF1